MVKKAVVFVCILACSLFYLGAADVISQPAATVHLIRTTVITVESLNERVAQYRKEAEQAGSGQQIDPLQVLDIMINDELVLQGAERDGYRVTDEQVNQLVSRQKASIEQQLNRSLTDEQFEQIVKNTYGMDLESFKKSLGESALVDQYVRGKMGHIVSSYKEPTEAEIQEFYRANRTAFVNPELVRLSHIFMPFTEENKAQVKAQMEQCARWLRYNTYTFEELVQKYSQDVPSKNKGGDIGWLAYDDSQMRSYLGSEFFEAVFDLPVGKPSGVLESNGGFHIVKVTVHTEPRMLNIDDYINPESQITVKEYIKQTLTARNQQEAYLKAIDELVASLRNEATITVLYTGEQKP